MRVTFEFKKVGRRESLFSFTLSRSSNDGDAKELKGFQDRTTIVNVIFHFIQECLVPSTKAMKTSWSSRPEVCVPAHDIVISKTTKQFPHLPYYNGSWSTSLLSGSIIGLTWCSLGQGMLALVHNGPGLLIGTPHFQHDLCNKQQPCRQKAVSSILLI